MTFELCSSLHCDSSRAWEVLEGKTWVPKTAQGLVYRSDGFTSRLVALTSVSR